MNVKGEMTSNGVSAKLGLTYTFQLADRVESWRFIYWRGGKLLNMEGKVLSESHDQRKLWEKLLGFPGATEFIFSPDNSDCRITKARWCGPLAFTSGAVSEALRARNTFRGTTVFESDSLHIEIPLLRVCRAKFEFSPSIPELHAMTLVGHLVGFLDV